jgi:tetratricopeptide (TPR) repeat protein
MPSREQQLCELTEQSLEAGRMVQAIKVCRELNTRFPDCFNGWRIAGEIHRKMHKADALLYSTERALSLRPNDPVVTLQRVEAYLGLNDLQSATTLLSGFGKTDLGSIELHDRAGRHMASLDMHDQAREQFEHALALEPNNATLLYNLATEQRFTGQIDAAVETLGKALAIDPLDFEAQAMRSSLRKQTHDTNHVAELRAILDDPNLAEEGETSICYALAKEYDDLDDFDRSFRFLKRGADRRRGHMSYSVETDVDVIEQIKATFSPVFFAQAGDGHDSEEPIFVVGLPRTGTTLVERILGSHSDVQAAGELDNFGREMMRLLEASGTAEKLDRTTVIKRSVDLGLEELGRSYVDSTRPFTGGTRHFIDKLPFNYLYLGLIHKALPHARIVNLQRHPVASCYSMYKQLFRDPYPFSYDLDDLATYYLAYRGLMEHWTEQMPGTIHTVYYEDLVDDTENETRRLLTHCGLDWEEACLRYYESEAASTTASAAQVRQPVYSRSRERWKLYEKHLAPLEQRLNDAGLVTRR